MSSLVSKIKYIFIIAFAMVVICAVDANADTAKFNDSQATVITGSKFKLGITGSMDGVDVISTDKSVVAVKKVNAKKIVLKAKKKGTAKIKLKCGKTIKKCKVTVNDTFCVSDSDLVISEPTQIVIHYTGKGFVKNIKPTLCEVDYSDHWNGDDVTVTITPIQKGSEKIKFFNAENSEIFYLKVKNVGAVKRVSVTSFNFETDNSAEAFIAGENKLRISYSVSADVADAVLNVVSRKTGVTVYSETLKNLTGGTVYYSTWDGCYDGKLAGQGTYYIELVGEDLYGSPSQDVALFAKSPFGKGDGSVENPYIISSVEDLILMSEYPKAHFKQECDIVIGMDNEKSEYELVKSFFDKEPFEGVYDGAGHTISDFYIYHSLFGILGEKAEVKNLTIDKGTVVGSEAFFADENNGRIENVVIKNCNIGMQQNATNMAMLTGYNGGVITNCDVSGSIILRKTIGNTTLAQENTLVAGMVIDNAGRIAYSRSNVIIRTDVTLTSVMDGTEYIITQGAIAAINQQSGVIANCKYGTDIQTWFHVPKGYVLVDSTLSNDEPVIIEGQEPKFVDNLKIVTDEECGEVHGLKRFSVIDCSPIPNTTTIGA